MSCIRTMMRVTNYFSRSNWGTHSARSKCTFTSHVIIIIVVVCDDVLPSLMPKKWNKSVVIWFDTFNFLFSNEQNEQASLKWRQRRQYCHKIRKYTLAESLCAWDVDLGEKCEAKWLCTARVFSHKVNLTWHFRSTRVCVCVLYLSFGPFVL